MGEAQDGEKPAAIDARHSSVCTPARICFAPLPAGIVVLDHGGDPVWDSFRVLHLPSVTSEAVR